MQQVIYYKEIVNYIRILQDIIYKYYTSVNHIFSFRNKIKGIL